MSININVVWVYVLSLVVVVMLAKRGMMMPYSAGAFGIALSAWFHVGYGAMIFICLSLYMSAMLSNGISEGSIGVSMDVGMLLGEQERGGNGLRTYVAKVALLVVFLFVPLPEPPTHIVGTGAMIMIGILVFIGSAQRGGGSLSKYLLVIGIQAVLIGTVSIAVDYWSDDLGGSLALMCCVSLPNFLFPPKERVREGEEEAHELTFGIVPIIFSCIFSFYTPGLSSSAIAGAFFPPDQHRVVAMAGLEGAMEGYVIHQLLQSKLVHKSPLGDLFGTDYVQWGLFMPSQQLIYLVLGAVLLSIVCVTLIPCPSVTHSGTLSVVILLSQSLVIAGQSTWIMLGVGFLCLLIRRSMCRNSESTLATAFIIPTVFTLPNF